MFQSVCAMPSGRQMQRKERRLRHGGSAPNPQDPVPTRGAPPAISTLPLGICGVGWIMRLSLSHFSRSASSCAASYGSLTLIEGKAWMSPTKADLYLGRCGTVDGATNSKLLICKRDEGRVS